MTVTSQEIIDGFGQFLQENVLTKMDSGRQFMTGLAYGIISAKSRDILNTIAENKIVKQLGIITQDNKIDIDLLYEAAQQQMKKQKKLILKIPYLGDFGFDNADLQQIYSNIVKSEKISK